MPVTGMITTSWRTVTDLETPPAVILTTASLASAPGLASHETVMVTGWSEAEPLAGFTLSHSSEVLADQSLLVVKVIVPSEASPTSVISVLPLTSSLAISVTRVQPENKMARHRNTLIIYNCIFINTILLTATKITEKFAVLIK